MENSHLSDEAIVKNTKLQTVTPTSDSLSFSTRGEMSMKQKIWLLLFASNQLTDLISDFRLS